jgi:predicted Rossmann fold flavoprotein
VIAIVGAGAAGLATAIFAARQRVGPLLLLESATRPGAKILDSGGSRCNVTNAIVGEADFNGSPPHLVRRVLRAFTVEQTVEFFRGLGVGLHEEEHGKLFPDANRSRVVLEALLGEVSRLGVELRTGERVLRVRPAEGGFLLETSRQQLWARQVVLASGGCSLPKSGSDGAGLRIAESLGHSVVAPTPALAPLVLEGSWHARLAGVTHPAQLTVHASGRPPVRRTGALLWTHFGVSGPVVLDVSRFWLRARIEGRAPRLEASLLPGVSFESCDASLTDLGRSSPRLTLANALARWLPAAVAEAVSTGAGLAPDQAIGRLRREGRRELVRSLVSRPLAVVDCRGWDHAEATAGGVPLEEFDTRTLASRMCAGLFAAGEVLDVDGRLGGFNFQWAWSSAWVAAGGLARALC